MTETFGFKFQVPSSPFAKGVVTFQVSGFRFQVSRLGPLGLFGFTWQLKSQISDLKSQISDETWNL